MEKELVRFREYHLYGDVEYVKKRNKLIPHAEVFADNTVKENDFRNDDAYKAEWNKVFHRKMDEMRVLI